MVGNGEQTRTRTHITKLVFFITIIIVALESVSADFFLFGEKVSDMVLLAEFYSGVQVSSPILLWTQFKLYGEFENTLYVSTLLHMLLYVVCKKKYIVSFGLLIKIHDTFLICLLVTLCQRNCTVPFVFDFEFS